MSDPDTNVFKGCHSFGYQVYKHLIHYNYIIPITLAIQWPGIHGYMLCIYTFLFCDVNILKY